MAGWGLGLGEVDRLLDVAFNALFDFRDARVVDHSALAQVVLEKFDGVLLPVFFDLLLRAIQLRVGHRVAAVAVGHRLDEVRPFPARMCSTAFAVSA